MITDISPVPQIEAREEVTAKDIMRIMGWSRDKAYRKRNEYLTRFNKIGQPLVVDDFCKAVGLARERVIPRLAL